MLWRLAIFVVAAAIAWVFMQWMFAEPRQK
jgi:hypothetical protein